MEPTCPGVHVFHARKRIKMANFVYCFTFIIVLCQHFVDSASVSPHYERSGRDLENASHIHRNRSQTPEAKYAKVLTAEPIPENVHSNTVLYDFNSVSLQNYAASSFRFKVISTEDSVPLSDSLFVIDESRRLRLGTSLSNSERKKLFDYEQYPTVVVIVEATRDSNPKGE